MEIAHLTEGCELLEGWHRPGRAVLAPPVFTQVRYQVGASIMIPAKARPRAWVMSSLLLLPLLLLCKEIAFKT